MFHFKRGVIFIIIVLCFLGRLTSKTITAAELQKPNIVIILADDLGYGDLSCYGNQSCQTPNLDRLAKEGMRFTDFHSSGPVCSPTRAGLLTGRYQQRAGIPGVIFADPKQNRHHGLHTRETTFAERLRESGYATGVFGKWHLGYHKKFNPVHHGFDKFRGYVSGNVDYISHVDRMGIADWWDGDKLSPEEGYCTHLITRHAVKFIETHRKKPFCLYIAHEAVHSPYQGPNDKPVRKVGQGRIPGAARKDIKAAYREMLEEMDRSVGQVVSALRKANLEKNTLVIFLSDNGANRNGSNGKLRGFKGSVWEGGHRVPAIAWWPGKIPAGSVNHQPTISIDIMPTILEAAGVKVPAKLKFDGISLLDQLQHKSKPSKHEPSSRKERILFWGYRNKFAVRQGQWKLVVNEPRIPGRKALFNLADDPEERKNIARQYPKKMQQLLAELERWKADVARDATPQPNQ
ncbi:MAG: sulfatase-like hydrolase/transferase [Planctomycetaceae bacterium]